jgi:histidinol-phosphate aminotransferase
MTIGKVRTSVLNLSGYRPGKAASQAEAEHGIENAIKLASNENPYSPPPPVAAAIADAIAGVNRYGDHRATAVRAAIAGWIGVDQTQVATGCGSSGLLQQVMFTYVDAGDEVVFPWPSFEIYPVFGSLFDATQVKVDLVDLGFDLAAVAAAVTDRTKVVFLATPNNPTGTCVSTEDIGHFLAEIPDDVIVVVDEAYREFNDPAFGDPVTELLPSHPNVLVTRTFSKAYGLAGLRTGYAIGDPELIEQLDKTQLAFSVNNLAQAGALAAIEHEHLAEANVAMLNAERERCVAALITDGWDLGPTHANFVFLPTGERTDEVALELEKQGVVVRPFSGFGIRITISTPEENDRWLAAL